MRSNSGTWGEAEEREKAEEWARGREKISARMQDAAEKTGVDEDDLVVLLQDSAEGSREDGIPPDSEAGPSPSALFSLPFEGLSTDEISLRQTAMMMIRRRSSNASALRPTNERFFASSHLDLFKLVSLSLLKGHIVLESKLTMTSRKSST